MINELYMINLKEMRVCCILIETHLMEVVERYNLSVQRSESRKESDPCLFMCHCLEILEKNRNQIAQLERKIETLCCNHSYVDDYIDISPESGKNIKYCEYCFKEV